MTFLKTCVKKNFIFCENPYNCGQSLQWASHDTYQKKENILWIQNTCAFIEILIIIGDALTQYMQKNLELILERQLNI